MPFCEQQGPSNLIADRVVTHVASLGSRVFVAVRRPDYHVAVQEWGLSSGAWAQLGTEFGPAPNSIDFFAQSIDSMRVFEAVLYTRTAPKSGESPSG